MATDIHAYPEIVRTNSVHSLECLAIKRDYNLFAVLALDRGKPPVVSPKGMPVNPGRIAREAYYLRISEDDAEQKRGGNCSPEEAELWIQAGLSRMVGEFITHPDWHTPSWLDVPELEEACAEYRRRFACASSELEELTAMLRAHASGGSPRLVFWFDS